MDEGRLDCTCIIEKERAVKHLDEGLNKWPDALG